VRAENDVVRFPTKRAEARARFDDFFEEEHERLFKALYFVTGNRHDAEELMQGPKRAPGSPQQRQATEGGRNRLDPGFRPPR
jgi:hypothetical protein